MGFAPGSDGVTVSLPEYKPGPSAPGVAVTVSVVGEVPESGVTLNQFTAGVVDVTLAAAVKAMSDPGGPD
jgi:hypothetical protein